MDVLREIALNISKYVSTATVWDAVDILIVTFIVFMVLRLLRNTNAMQVLRGLLVLLVLTGLAGMLHLYSLNFLMTSALQVGLIALIILFQPELRRGLEQMGSTRISGLFGRENTGSMDYVILQTVDACKALSWAKQGALIVFERRAQLGDIVKTGTLLDAVVTSELLKNMFYPKAPLHDGAVIIRSGRLAGAGCILPLTNNLNLSRDLGMRHRAGIGVSEVSDAVVVIVSEETGSISVATEGMLKRHLTAETLEKLLRTSLSPHEEEQAKKGLWGVINKFTKKKE